MIVLDATDLRRNVIAPISSPIGSSLSGKDPNDVDMPEPPPRLGTSRIEGKRIGANQHKTRETSCETEKKTKKHQIYTVI